MYLYIEKFPCKPIYKKYCRVVRRIIMIKNSNRVKILDFRKLEKR